MPSYRDGQPTGLTTTRIDSTRTAYGSRSAVAGFAGRSVIAVRRYCVPSACDVGTRADLYDIDHCVGQLTTMPTKCCIPDTRGNPCGSKVMVNSPYPVCLVHAATISEFFLKQDQLELARQAVYEAQAAAPSTRLPGGVPRASVVYYVQVDAAVKIGTTTNIEERMKAYPPHARLLATEPGGYALEAKRHKQFNEYLRAGKEWFHPGPRLRAHIEALMAEGAVA